MHTHIFFKKLLQNFNFSGNLFWAFIFISSATYSQDIPIGTWRTHAAYNNVLSIAITPDKIYAGSSGGLFYFDKQYNNTSPLTKLDGLSDTDVRKIKYEATSQTLIIIYNNGNIDLLHKNKIKNLNLILLSSSIQNKNINHINIFDSYAYLAFDFGMVVLDIAKQEIKETWLNLGLNGTRISIYGSAFLKDSVFLATAQGIIKSPRKNNLQDFNSWESKADGMPVANPVKAISTDGINMYAGVENEGIYNYQLGKWNKVILPNTINQINSIEFSEGKLILTLSNLILIKDANGQITQIQNILLPNPQQSLLDSDGKLWIAENQNGLFNFKDNNLQTILPNGPYRREAFQLYNYDENIIALSGGYNTNGFAKNNFSGYYFFSQQGWKNFNKDETIITQQIPPLKDLVSATFNAKDKNLYIGSFGTGILINKPDGSFSNFDQNNSPLPAQANITALTTDVDGNLWALHAGANFGNPSLYVYQNNKTWKSFTFDNPSALFPTQLIIDQNNFKWMPILPSQGVGLWVFDEKKNRGRLLNKNPGEGNLPTSNVYSIAIDMEGAVWAGTDRGVGVFYNTSQIFGKNSDAIQPIFDKRPLLREEIVTSIAVDGGNRKWMGTRNGLWLFNTDGTQLISHFTSANAPLPSDNIISIAIQPVTGEVFVATDNGIVSYRGSATFSDGSNKNVKIFPNPVRPGFEGLIGISGLASNATVKITDVAGRLVFQTHANGGTATWDKKDYKGRAVYSGIYVIFSALPDGTEGYVGKIAIID